MNTRKLMRIRRWVSLIGILTILSGLVIVPTASAYTGADAPSWATAAVNEACDRGIIDCELATPGFTTNVNRAVGYQMLTAGFAVLTETALSPFTDITGQWYASAAHTAYTLGWTAGSPADSGLFAPTGNFTRAQMAVAVAQTLGLTDGTAADLNAYTDKGSVPSWATAKVAAMVNAGLMGQGGNTTLRPNDPISKVETIVVLNSSVTYQENNDLDVLEVAATRLGTGVTVDDVQTALDEGKNYVSGAWVAVVPVIPPVGTSTPPGTSTTPTGSVTVARATDTPAAAIMASGTAFNPIMKVNFTAPADADAQITGFKITRSGYSANANVAGVGVFDSTGVRHGNIGTSWNDDNTMDLGFSSAPIAVTRGTTVPVTLKVNLATGSMSGTLVVSLASASAVTASGTVNGTFPVASNTMDLRDGSSTVGAVTVDDVQVNSNGTDDTTSVSVALGTTRQQVATFRIANSNVEAVTLKSITLYNNGSAADGDVNNITLVGPDGTDLKTVNQTTSKYVTFSDLNFSIAKSASSKDFKVYIDVVGGSTRTVRFLLQNDYDLVLEGATSAAQILPTLAATNDTAFPVGDIAGANYVNKYTIASGTLSFSKASGSPTGNVAQGSTGVKLATFELKSVGENMEIRQFSYRIGTTSSASALSGTLYFKIHEGTSTSYTTLYSIAGASAQYTTATAYTTTFTTITAGKTYYLDVIGDVSSTAVANGTYAIGPVDITQVKRVSTNDIVDPGVSTATGNTLTVKAGSLTVTKNSGAAAVQLVAGQTTQATLGTFDFTANSAEGISITNVVIGTSTGVNIGQDFKELELWVNGVKKSVDSSSTLSPSATASSVTFNINPAVSIAASQTAVIEIKGKALTTATAGTITLTIAASGITGQGVTSQTALSTTPVAAVSGQVITVNSSGTLIVARDTVANVKSAQIVAGTTNVTFGAYKLTTGNIEDVKIKKITVRNIGTNIDGIVDIGVYNGAELVNSISKASLGSDGSVLGNDKKSVTFDYSTTPILIPKNSSLVLTVKANTVYSATNGDTVQLAIDSLDAEGAGSAVKIYPTITSETMSATTTTYAYAAGEVIAGGNGNLLSLNGGTSTWISPVTTAISAAGTSTGSGAIVAGFSTAGLGLTSTVTKINPVYLGSTIISEVPSAASTYLYTAGDVIAYNDANGTTTTGVYVVGTTTAVGTNLLTAANTLVSGVDPASGDRITRLSGGYSELVSTAAGTNYNLGDIIALSQTGTTTGGVGNAHTTSGLYVVTSAVSQGATMIGMVLPRVGGGLTVTNDRVAKMPTASTEAPSTSATYAYAVGDVIVVDDTGTAANNGSYVVKTAVAVGGSLTATNALGVGITFATGDRISKLYVKAQEDNLKRLYPTKLNFTWVPTAASSLVTTTQSEVARFNMGADASNTNNPSATISMTALNLTKQSTATLTSFTLNDIVNGNVTTTYAPTSNFTSAAIGGTLAAQTFQQGETRTYKVLADVGTNIANQTAQFKFNAGTQFTAGSATWSVTNNAVSSSSTWTILAADAADVSSTSLTATNVSDNTAPTISIITIANGTNANFIDTGDTVTITFSEKMDPATISSTLRYGGSSTSIGSTSTGGISTATTTTLGSTTTVTITNIGAFTSMAASAAAMPTTCRYLACYTVDITTDVNLSSAGTVLIVEVSGTTTGATGAQGAGANAQTLGSSSQVAGTVKDNAGNALATVAMGSGITPTGSF